MWKFGGTGLNYLDLFAKQTKLKYVQHGHMKNPDVAWNGAVCSSYGIEQNGVNKDILIMKRYDDYEKGLNISVDGTWNIEVINYDYYNKD